MKKRILAALLAVLLLGSVLTPAVFADEGHIITFDPMATEGGMLPPGAPSWKRIPDGQPIGEMPVPTNSNPKMSFEGWFDEDHNQYTAETILTSDVVVHAYWMEKQATLPFTDISGHWAYEGIKYCYDNGLMNGMTPTTFGPELTTTRAMVVTVLYRMNSEPVGGLTNPFKDVEFEDWYGPAIVWAAARGIVNGVTKDTFDPNGNITREQLAAILYRYAEAYDYVTDIKYLLNDFKDKDSVSPYAVEPMKWTYAMDLITGMQEGKDYYLKPQNNATRAQIATILMRFMENVVPHEMEARFDGLKMTLPASWYLQYTYLAEEVSDGVSQMTFWCRREQENGGGGYLFTIELRDGAVPSEYGPAFEVVGAIHKDGRYRNVVIIYAGGEECDKYKDLYFAMLAEKEKIVKSFRGYDGWSFAVG